MSSAPMELIESDFVVLKEDYNRYLVEDRTVLKIKIVIRKVFRTPITNPQGYPAQVSFDSLNAVSAIVPAELKRPPSKEAWDPTRDVGKEMKFEPYGEERWQEYLTLDGFRVMVKPVLVKVFKFDKYNVFGEPTYSVNVQAITNMEKATTTA